jgi:hypothetical protein
MKEGEREWRELRENRIGKANQKSRYKTEKTIEGVLGNRRKNAQCMIYNINLSLLNINIYPE